MKGQWLGWVIFAAIVTFIIGYAVYGNAKTNKLIKTAALGSGVAQEKAIIALNIREDAYDLLQGQSIKARVSLASALEHLDDKAAIELAIKMSKDPDKEVRISLVQTLTVVGPKDIKALADGLGKGDPNITSTISLAVTNIGEPAIPFILDTFQAKKGIGPSADLLVSLCASKSSYRDIIVPKMLPWVSDADVDLKKGAIETLGKIADKRAAKEVAAHLNDGPELRRIVIAALGSIADLSSEKILDEAVKNPMEDRDARIQAALGLGRIASPTAVQTLKNCLKDVNLPLRSAAVVGLQTAAEKAVPAISEALKDPNPAIRVEAASVLATATKDPKALALLANCLKDPIASVRVAAVTALGASASASDKPTITPQQIALLVSALKDKDGAVAAEASTQLGKAGPAAINSLAGCLDSGMDTCSYLAAQALGNIGAPALPALKGKLNNRWAVLALGQIHDPSIKELLIKAKTSSNPDVRYVASQALATNFGITR
ncbi:MAG: HEAT repeat domain-containing protein [bacterium]